MVKNFKGFGTKPVQKNKYPKLLLVGDGVSPAILAKDPSIQKAYPGITASDFIWWKVARVEEFGDMPKTVTLQTTDGKIQRIYTIPAGLILKPNRVYTGSDLDWELLAKNIIGGQV